jgi:hypothetical protein
MRIKEKELLYTLTFSFWFLFFAVVLTYLVWGFVMAYEIVAAMGGSAQALEWIKAHHSYKELYIGSILFYPMILLGYLFLEMIPHYLFKVQEYAPFDLQKVFDRLYRSH